MINKTVAERFRLIFTKEDMERIHIKESDNGKASIMVDVHGMKCAQAKRFISNLINIARSKFHLVVIHGYNHGTAIKDMLAHNFENPHIGKQYVDPYNMGITHMQIV